MQKITNLRRLRGRYHVSLLELEAASGLSNQYISSAELGKIQPSRKLEERLCSAIEVIIVNRKKDLLLLEEEYRAYRGSLLRAAEENENE